MFEKIYELPINREYVRHWGMVEAIRELIQNAIDSDSPFEWSFTNDSLSIKSKFTTLEPKTLLLGTTTKSDDEDAIGSFGEGYKIAMLVLTRLDYEVIVHNGNVVWTPEFRMNKKFGSETLHIVETAAVASREGVTFEVRGLGSGDIEDIRESCLQMQDNIGEFKQTKYGDILIQKPKKLFVGGLYICNTDLDYGYNIHPSRIKLERDRQTVDSFDLQLLTKDMWFDINEPELVAELMEQQCPDMKYADWSTPDVVQAACYALFQEKYPNAIIADNNAELKRLVAKGMTNTIYLGGSFASTVKSSYGYSAKKSYVAAKATPTSELEEFYNSNKQHMKRFMKEKFRNIIKSSKAWGYK